MVSAQEGERGLVLSPPADRDLEPKIGKTETLFKTYDEDQLDEEADESHDDEAERGLGGDLGELCCE